MKKTLLIVCLALVLVMALGATPAFAKYAGFSSTTQYIPWATASSMASNNADSALQGTSPHGNYGTTTIKCAVCHSVHRATNKLLVVDGTCAYCHTNSYYGGGSVSGSLVSWKVTSGGGPHSSFCSGQEESCHGSVHGAEGSAYAGPAAMLLKVSDTRLASSITANNVALTTATQWSDANMRALGTDALCTDCHTNSVFGVVSAGATLTVSAGVSGLTSATAHRAVAVDTDNWNSDQLMSKGKTGYKIAWKPVEYCNSCHDLTDDNNGGNPAFPHAINDVVSTAQGKNAGNRSAVWLTAAPDSAAQSMAVSGYNTYAVSGDGSVNLAAGNAAAGSTIIDGICLKCHRSATEGVGVTF